MPMLSTLTLGARAACPDQMRAEGRYCSVIIGTGSCLEAGLPSAPLGMEGSLFLEDAPLHSIILALITPSRTLTPKPVALIQLAYPPYLCGSTSPWSNMESHPYTAEGGGDSTGIPSSHAVCFACCPALVCSPAVPPMYGSPRPTPPAYYAPLAPRR